jgi:hypothetical protein
MRIFKKDKKKNDAPIQELQFEVKFKVRNRARGYNDNQTLVKVVSEQTLNSTTDTAMKALKKEIEDVITCAVEDLDEKITGCKHMTDGYWQEVQNDECKPDDS